MAEEIREVVEILKLMEMFTSRLTEHGLRGLSFLAKLYYSKHWDHEGKQSFDYVMKACKAKGEGFEILSIATEDKEVIQRMENKLNELRVQYAELPDLCQGDGFTQFALPQSQIPLFKNVLERELDLEYQHLKLEDYEETADPEVKQEIDKEGREGALKALKENPDLSTGNFDKTQEAIDNVNFRQVSLNNKSLIKPNDQEDPRFIIATIPGTKFEHKVFIPKEDVDISKSDDKTTFVNINMNSYYHVVQNKGQQLPKMSGKELLQYFGDPINKIKDINQKQDLQREKSADINRINRPQQTHNKSVARR